MLRDNKLWPPNSDPYLPVLSTLVSLNYENLFGRTILYAISLGGDTYTIATMAGAMGGAYYELDRVPQHWQDICEGVPDAVSYAKQLHTLCSDLMDSHK